jgi:nucleoside-diphosphate-sugar epimerase
MHDPPIVLAMARRDDGINSKGLTTLVCDLTDPQSLNLTAQRAAEIDVVYHLAAVNPDDRPNRKLMQDVNSNGTKNLFNAVHDSAKHFVYVSGVAVFKPDRHGSEISEESPKSQEPEYVRIRIEAEQYLRENCAKSGIDFTVVYFPDIVYGNAGTFRRVFLEQISKGKFRIPGTGEYYTNVIYIEDAVNILVTVAQKRGETANETYIASDSRPPTFREFVNFIADQLGAKHPGSVPIFLAKAAVGSDLIRMLTRNAMASNQKAAEIYDFQFPTYQSGITDVVSQFKGYS